MTKTVVFTHSFKYQLYEEYSPSPAPFVSVRIYMGKEVFTADALLDSGAVLSAFDYEYVHLWGIDEKKLSRVKTPVVGGTTYVYVANRLPIRVDPLTQPIKCRVGFIHGLSTNIVGRLGVFDQLQVNFDEAEKTIHMAINSPGN